MSDHDDITPTDETVEDLSDPAHASAALATENDGVSHACGTPLFCRPARPATTGARRNKGRTGTVAPIATREPAIQPCHPTETTMVEDFLSFSKSLTSIPSSIYSQVLRRYNWQKQGVAGETSVSRLPWSMYTNV